MNHYLASVIADLQAGKTIKNYREGGNSMTPLIVNGQKQTLVPILDFTQIKRGDIVLCKVKGNHFTHLVKAVRTNKGQLEFLIGNNHGHVNGWAKQKHVFGKSADVYW